MCVQRSELIDVNSAACVVVYSCTIDKECEEEVPPILLIDPFFLSEIHIKNAKCFAPFVDLLRFKITRSSVSSLTSRNIHVSHNTV